ncbi:MAG: hypothetical protein J7598_09475 [Mitsuaria chitosanitabida]|uniref:hypothetical protein n=1 Tax=Roseateles chitosanitabidus TaxID=65048 RepID=UPI001B0F0452|nr:hypothetical protein [Roseateles chitosanitabidus]MBO9686831.1 hypothetical protein [Roseateles chitosanitabidus]
MQISPIKIAAGIAAVVLAVAGLFIATQMRQGAVDMLSSPGVGAWIKRAPPARPAEPSATASGVRVIPFGVTEQPGASRPGKPAGG